MSFQEILVALAEAEIDFVVVGGVGAVLQGVPVNTFDLDIVHSRDEGNRGRLHSVLRSLEAVYREHLPKRLEPTESDFASDGHMLLMTRLGPLDVLGRVAGGWDFDDLVSRSRSLSLTDDLDVRVVDLEALIEIKEALGREKDLAVLPVMRRTLAERRREG